MYLRSLPVEGAKVEPMTPARFAHANFLASLAILIVLRMDNAGTVGGRESRVAETGSEETP